MKELMTTIGRLRRIASHRKGDVLWMGLLVGGLLVLGMGGQAHASSMATTPFDDLWATLSGWTQGGLGHVLAGTMVLTGAGMGVARQSLMSLVTGVGLGMGTYYAPEIINNISSVALSTHVAVVPLAVRAVIGA